MDFEHRKHLSLRILETQTGTTGILASGTYGLKSYIHPQIQWQHKVILLSKLGDELELKGWDVLCTDRFIWLIEHFSLNSFFVPYLTITSYWVVNYSICLIFSYPFSVTSCTDNWLAHTFLFFIIFSGRVWEHWYWYIWRWESSRMVMVMFLSDGISLPSLHSNSCFNLLLWSSLENYLWDLLLCNVHKNMFLSFICT